MTRATALAGLRTIANAQLTPWLLGDLDALEGPGLLT